MTVKAIYARQSVDREDSISVESQIEFCGYELRGAACREYIDKGYSGKDVNRPAFKALLNDIRRGEIDTVIVYRLDRISRSILDFTAMMEIFQEHGVEFVSSTEAFDTTSPMGRAMLNICMVFAQLERETIQKRVADACHSRSKKGFYMGGRVPYGFRLTDTEIDGVKTSCYAPIGQEVEQIRLIYTVYNKPEASLADVIHYLNRYRHSNLRGQAWTPARISELLRSPVYVRADAAVYHFFKRQGAVIIDDAADYIGLNGCYLYKGETSGRKQYELHGKHLVLAPHEGIIPAEEWLRCRLKLLGSRQCAIPRKPRNSWLAGKVKCRICGYALTVRRNHQDKRYLVCTTGKSGHADRCGGPGTLHAEQVETAVAMQIARKLAEFPALAGSEAATPDPKRSETGIRLARLEEEIHALIDRVPKADDALMRYIGERVSALDKERECLMAEYLSPERPSRPGPLSVITTHAEMWNRLPLEEKLLVVDALIDRILLGANEIEILWRI